MVDTRRSSAKKRSPPSSEEASPSPSPPPPPPPPQADDASAAAAAAKAPSPATAGEDSSPPRTRQSKRAKALDDKTLAAEPSSPAVMAATGTAKAAGLVVESSQCTVRANEGTVPASSTVSNSGSRKKRTPRRLQSPEETTAEEMAHWKTKHRGATAQTLAWGRLISQSSLYPSVSIYNTHFTVGHGAKHDLKLTDSSPGILVCKMKHARRGAAIEVCLSKAVYVNGKALDRPSKVTLIGGDEVIFCSLGRHAYIFQQLPEEKSSTSTFSSPFVVQPGEYPVIKGTPDHLSYKRAKLSVPFSFGKDRSPFVPHEIVSSLCKTMEEQGQFSSEENVSFAQHQLLKEDLKKAVVSASDISESFDSFPYYLSESTKTSLLTPAHVNLCCKEATKWTKNISFISQRLLLSGPAGSEIYQEMLVKALTKHFDAKLLIVDSSMLLGVSLLTIVTMLILLRTLTRATTAILKESTTSYI